MAVINGKKIFGTGRAFAINNITNPTPIRYGLIQDQSLTVKREVKEVFGEKAFAADVRGGTMSFTGKVNYATMQNRLWAELMFENTPAGTTQTQQTDNESGTVGSSPNTYTVTNSPSITDLGVILVITGKKLARVAPAAEIAGSSYSVNETTGVYTFAAGDSGKSIKVSYLYTGIGISSASGQISLNNQNQGENSNFKAVHVFLWNFEQDVFVLNNCVGSDAEVSSKSSDYGKPTFAFTAACDTSDSLGTFAYAESN